ncbi:MAG TPA: cation:proton antiporter [Myxococcus sp.]|nr:cation:proton antiporter [Myxococcus sp.]
MDVPAVLQELVLVLGVAVAVVLALSHLRLPTIAGLIAAGALIGPGGLGWVRDAALIEVLAGIGVVLLLFSIGLEFSLGRLKRLWRVLLLGGGLQVGLTTLAVMAGALALGFPAARGVFFGFLVALSSTAIVLRALTERHEVDAPHGRLIIGALIFQDLCVVPMMLAVPLLAGQRAGLGAIAWVLGKAVLLVVATAVLGRTVVPRFLKDVAATRRREVFILAVLGLCVGIAWVSSLAGLSLALGAFLAGIALADGDYGHQALADVLPLRETLSSFFFISVGMLLDVRVLVERPLLVGALVVGVVLVKALAGAVSSMVMRFPPWVAVLAGLGLAQIGEFSFVLAHAGAQAGLLSAEEQRLFITMSVLTMLVTPLALHFGPRLAAGASHLKRLEALIGAHGPHHLEGTHSDGMRDHFIIAGLGTAGRLVTRALRESRVPHVCIDLDPEVVADARKQGEALYYGDITSTEILEKAGLHRARALVLLLDDPLGAARAVAAARRLHADVPIMVRVHRLRDIADLRELGASEVLAGELETALEAVSRVLKSADLSEDSVAKLLDTLRREHPYGLPAPDAPAAPPPPRPVDGRAESRP